ncbi:cell division protein FtsQ/DivIB [Marinicella rhabdoformis]|uniref:cell division protein FtsQ/DivIB n=1 Tax=Marinicella rhabdoformis TaxID=2580566 RepID=UPI0012AEB5E9|nr:FtsQ-type POTRA domain-containing protein [Marinicella rhabdoformis]
MSKTLQLMIIMVLLMLLLVVAMMGGLIESDRWKIKHLSVAASYERMTPEQLRLTIAKTPERSFFRLDAEQVKKNIESMAWVRSAHVVKQWPDTLNVTVKEHQAVAVWNDEGLLNQLGNVFFVDKGVQSHALPRLFGKDEHAADVWADFNRFNQLLQPVGHEIGEAHVNARGDWKLVLRNGLVLVLGTEQHEARILRLAETWDALLAQSVKLPERVDLRYSNGYVVLWREQEEMMERKVEEGELFNHG